MTLRLTLTLALAIATAASLVAAQDARPASYAGRPLVDVLRDLTRQGLRIVFSTEVVRPAWRVTTEPSGPAARDVLDQILQPYGLRVRPGPRGTLIVARAPRATASPPIQAPATLRGRVVDAETDAPLAHVLVVARKPERQATTDADGRFELAGLEPGSHSLYVSLVGYGLARPEILVPEGGLAEILIPLAPGAGAYTEQLTVRGGDSVRAVTPVQVTVRNAELQELRGVLADDPFRALQTMPGVATGDDFRAEFSVRASEFRQMGFSVDGVAAPWLVHSVRAVEDTGTVAMINADALDEVTLVSGASPQAYGDRTGAWIHTVIREGSRDAFRVGGTLSGTGASVLAEGPLGGARRGAWLLSVRQSYIDWLIRRIATQEQTTFGFTDAQSKLVFDLTPRHQVQLTALAGRSRMDEQDDTPSLNGVRIGRASTGLLIGAWRATLGNAVVLTQRTSMGGTEYRNTNDFGQEVARGRDWMWTYRTEASLAPRSWLTLDGGASIDRAWYSFRRQQYGGSISAPVLRSSSLAERGRSRQGGHVRARLTSAAAVGIDAGVRVDHDSLSDRWLDSPWLLGRWSPAERWTFAAGTGLAHQLPELAQISPTQTVPLDAERARYVDVSAEYRVSPGLALHAAFFDRQEQDVLRFDAPATRLVNGVPSTPGATSTWTNQLAVSARGVEITLRRMAPSGLVGWISYAYGRARSTDASTGEQYWSDFDQRHLLNVHASYRLSTRTHASAKLRVGSNMPVLGYFAADGQRLTLAATRNDLRLPTYARLDLRLNRTYDFTRRRLTLFAEVLNVLNRENVGRTDGTVRTSGVVSGFVETLFPLLPSAGIRIEF